MKGKIAITTVGFMLIINSLAFSHANFTGYSGAPGSRGTCASSCHGSSGGTIEISGFPSEYIPEQTYTITISHSSGNSIKQFNGSCRLGVGSTNAGVLAAGANTATYNRSEETNGIHFSSSDHDNGTLLWTAPAGGTGEVRLYIAGHQGGFSGQNSALILVSDEQATNIHDELSGMPSHYSLRGNYPNPFNASTIIKYDLPVFSDVRIDIFDMLGRKVETWIDESQPAGYHQIVWDGSGQSSGVYFYKIQAGEYSQTRRMLLLK